MGAWQSCPQPLDPSDPLYKLQAAWPSVVSEPIEAQAKYADVVCISSGADASFCEEQLAHIRKAFPHGPPNNTTGVGNIAYLALHGHQKSREEYKTVHYAYMMLLARRFNLPVPTR